MNGDLEVVDLIPLMYYSTIRSESEAHSGDSSTDCRTAEHTDLHCSWSLLWICSYNHLDVERNRRE